MLPKLFLLALLAAPLYGGTIGAPGVPIAAIPSPDDGIQKFAQLILDAVNTGNWKALAALVLIGVIWTLRKYGSKLPGKAGILLASDRGGVAIALLTSVGGAVGTALLARAPLTMNLMVSALITGALASGMFHMGGHLMAPKDKRRASGKAAALLPLLFIAGTFAGCACFKPASPEYNSPKCVVARQSVDCTTAAVKRVLPSLLPVAAWLFGGATGDAPTDQIVSALETNGADALGCAGTQIANDFATHRAASLAEREKHKIFNDRFADWKAKNGFTSVTFKLAPPAPGSNS